MKILIIGKKSFIAKNFINKYSKNINFFYFDLYFKDNYNDFIKKIVLFVNKNKIKHIINFIGNNDNSLLPIEEKNILRDNFILPLVLVDVFRKQKINFTFFLSAEIDKIEKPYENNLYALSKFFLKDSLRFILKKNKISLIKIDNVYGPFDFNFNRLIPSLMLKIILKKNLKINMLQKKKLIYVKDLLPIIFRTIKNRKPLNIVNVKAKNINISNLWKKINNNYKKITKSNIFYSFVETLDWYKKNLFIVKKLQKRTR